MVVLKECFDKITESMAVQNTINNETVSSLIKMELPPPIVVAKKPSDRNVASRDSRRLL